MKNLKKIREVIQKENDINVCLNLLSEIEKRSLLIIDATQKSEKYMNDIQEYLTILQKRGVDLYGKTRQESTPESSRSEEQNKSDGVLSNERVRS